MRYKGTYRPQYILGKSYFIHLLSSWIKTNSPDPESYTWDPLDGELSKKLDERPYVSLSRDRKLASQKESSQDASTAAEASQGKETGENDEEMSLFDLHMPGVLTVEEVQALDLDHWLLLVHGSFLEMTVSYRPRITSTHLIPCPERTFLLSFKYHFTM